MLAFKVRKLIGMIAVFGMILATSMKANAYLGQNNQGCKDYKQNFQGNLKKNVIQCN